MNGLSPENIPPRTGLGHGASLQRAFPLLAARIVTGLFSLQAADALAQSDRPPSDRLGWEPFFPGVERRWIYEIAAEGPAAALIRFQPGARVPLHEHLGFEHILVLSGSQTDEAGLTAAGTLIVNPPGSRHSIISEPGCVVLAIYDRPVRFLPVGP